MKTTQIVALLQQKTKLFSVFFQVSEQMCTEPAELLEKDMNKRLELQEQIEALDAQLELLYQQDPAAHEAAENQVNYSTLSPDGKLVYDAAMQLHAVLARLQQLEPLIEKRLNTERARLLLQLEDSQKSPAAAAHRYYQAAHLEGDIFSHGNRIGKA